MGHPVLDQIFSIPLETDKFLVYAPLKKTAFVANAALVNALHDRCLRGEAALPAQTDPLACFEASGFFRPEPLPPDDFHSRGVSYDSLVLFLTNRCNLRCSYCYASSGEGPASRMPWETARAGIDFVLGEVIRNKAPTFSLGFHGGGEPTMNWPVLTRSVEYARQQTDKFRIPLQLSGSFNGYWRKPVRDFMVRNFTEISLSYDGLPSVQNRFRPAAGGRASFPLVRKTLQALDEATISYGIRMTLTDESLPLFPKSIAFICKNFRPRTIQAEPAFREGRAKRNGLTVTNPEIFVDRFMDALRIAESHGVTLFYSGARLDSLSRRFCLAACRALVVTAEGAVTTCFETYGHGHPLSNKFVVGRYEGRGRFVIDDKKRRDHFARTVDRIPFCDGCFCKWHCAGDCAIKSVADGNDGLYEPGSRCRVNQELTKRLLLDRIRRSPDGIWSGEIRQDQNRGGRAWPS